MLHSIRWTVEKIGQRLALIEPLVYRRRAPMLPFRYHALPSPDAAPILDPAASDGWTEIEPNTYWGTWVTDFMLHGQFEVPADWSSDAPIALYLPLGDAGEFTHPEALIYVDGTSYGTCDRQHQEVLLRPEWHDGNLHHLALHGWTGNGGFLGADTGTKLLMRPCEVVQIDQPTRDFTITARVALGIARALDANTPARAHLLNALDAAFRVLDTREPFGEAFYASVPAAHDALRTGVEAAGAPLDVDVVATGHAHIDVAWLWTLGQTRRKAGRTFHTALRMMEQFPDYHFTQSQPQLYEYVRQDYPELFEAIKARIAEGRWEITGDMWVEADCNLSGPESLARQFLLGRMFFREHFGKGTSSGVLWLPDVFGYAWALPQLIKHADLDYFFTIKIGWSQYNRLPYDSFWWQGLDGTRVLTHFSPTPEKGSAYASTYNAKAEPEDVLGTWTNFRQKDLTGGDGASPIPPLLMAFGYGDGGGGPTREMLENLREMQTFPATPQVRQGAVGDFFAQLEQTAGDRLPVWNGELYLEYHRGTYTTQSRNKRANRKSEFLLHDAEFLATLASLLDSGYTYPSDTFRDAWRLICLNQFHDIIPGSSVNAVYVDSTRQYGEIADMGTAARDTALQHIASAVGGDVLVINPTSFSRSDLAFLPTDAADLALTRGDGDTVRTQPVEGGVLIDTGTLAPYSVTTLRAGSGAGASSDGGPTATPTLLENDFVRVELNADGDITRIYDKQAKREALAKGAVANQFQAFEDRPKYWDAWDVDIFFDDKQWLAEPASNVSVVEQGALRATLEIRRRILNSSYVQRISLAYNSPRIDIDTTIEWQERHVLLKAAFPVDILAPTATFDIQWGNVQRPTHRNTSWDWARFETCAQKWVDLSEGDYGVSLLNDCKYGHDIRDNVIRISLLRSPTHPDPEADQGQHRFTYAILPHSGGWNDTTIAQSYALNDPLITFDARSGATDATNDGWTAPLVAFDQPNIVIETVKRAEDGDGIIVRGYESQRRRGPVTLRASFGLARACHANLLEEDGEALALDGTAATFEVRPYQIFTLRLVPNS